MPTSSHSTIKRWCCHWPQQRKLSQNDIISPCPHHHQGNLTYKIEGKIFLSVFLFLAASVQLKSPLHHMWLQCHLVNYTGARFGVERSETVRTCPWHTGSLTNDRSGLSKLPRSLPTEQQQKKILVKTLYLLDTEGNAAPLWQRAEPMLLTGSTA